MRHEKILLEHGSGGLLSNGLINDKFLPLFKNTFLERLEDGAIFDVRETKLCFSTDSYVVQPVFFPGGNIGSLAVHGTVNDISMCGGKPLYLSTGFIIEEGFLMKDLETIIASMAGAAEKSGVIIVTGDTKVVPKGTADGIFINTSGIGMVTYKSPIGIKSIRPGDCVIINGTIGDHGTAILSVREGIDIGEGVLSDSSPLNSIVEEILEACPDVHCMRDATRGGLGAILAEIAQQSGFTVTIDESLIPVREQVRGACEILGLDALYLANEGKFVIFCPQTSAGVVLDIMRANPLGTHAALIGTVNESSGRGRLILKTAIGGSREIDLPTGELVPRIC
ncbi:MAG TPA: hydrogenase expression/formation protein HypE [Desulfomonilia bacterium]